MYICNSLKNEQNIKCGLARFYHVKVFCFYTVLMYFIVFFFFKMMNVEDLTGKKDLNLSYSSFDIFGYLRFYLFIYNIINIKTIVWFFFIYLLYLCDTLMVWKHAMCVYVVTEASMKWNTFVHFLIFFGWLMASFCNWNSMKI